MVPFLIGILAGIFGGMGIGGGAVLIPLIIVFSNVNQQTAQSINLIAFIPSSIVALIVHYKNKTIDVKLAKKLILPGIIFACLGSFIAINLNPIALRKIFSLFLFFMGILEFMSIKKC